MPELPEVETVRRHLSPVMLGRRITAAEVHHERTARHNARPADVPERLAGRRVLALSRHGKFLLGGLEGDLTLVVHLGMSGRMQVATRESDMETHTRFTADLASGDQIRMVDPRTFGFVGVFTPKELAGTGVARLGPDAWTHTPSPSWWADRLSGRSAPIKALLLDQRIVAGLGNIYGDEVLHRAGIHPLRPGGGLVEAEIASLAGAIRPILSAGIAAGGTSLDDLAYLLPDGRAGDYLVRLQVYGRVDLPCPQCGTAVERTVVAQRSAHFCPRCQPMP